MKKWEMWTRKLPMSSDDDTGGAQAANAIDTGNLASYCKLSDNYTGDLLRTCKNLRELAEDLREQMSQCCCPTTLEARDLPMLSTDDTGSAQPANVIDQRHW